MRNSSERPRGSKTGPRCALDAGIESAPEFLELAAQRRELTAEFVELAPQHGIGLRYDPRVEFDERRAAQTPREVAVEMELWNRGR